MVAFRSVPDQSSGLVGSFAITRGIEKLCPDDKMKEPIPYGKRLLPFEGCTYRLQLKFAVNSHVRNFTALIYAAYNALGLIGSERNGVAICDDDERAVLVDEILCADSGYFGPTKEQIDFLECLVTISWAEFRALVNSHPRARYQI